MFAIIFGGCLRYFEANLMFIFAAKMLSMKLGGKAAITVNSN